MMQSQSISSLLNPASTLQPNAGSEILGKEDFLKMLVAQMRFQNPLEPMNDQEFVAQMAQFSSLEQLQNMNDTLAQNTDWNMLLSNTISNTMATSLIGKTVYAETDAVSIVAGKPTPIAFRTTEYALNGTITIYNSAGEPVRTLAVTDLAAGENSVSWNGKDNQGNTLPDGDYTFEIDLRNTKGEHITAESYREDVVEGVKYVDGVAYLRVGGTLIPLSQVREVGPGRP